ncbi:MAG: hypothetical protein ACQERZ_06415 [Fusobacteriota bacterium]
MGKRVMLVTFFMLILVSYGQVDSADLEMRVLELKSDLKKELHKKSYGNEVVGSYEIKGENVKFDTYMIPIAGRPRQEKFRITEVRNISDFSTILAYEENLPKYNINEKKPSYLLRSLVAILSLLFMGLMVYTKKNILKRDQKNKDENKEIDKGRFNKAA